MSTPGPETATFSLSRTIESHFGLPPPHLKTSQSFEARGLYNWYRIVHVSLVANQHGTPEIEDLLSNFQLKSFRLLWEWWTAQYQDPILSMNWRSELVKHYIGGYDELEKDLCEWGFKHSSINVPELQWKDLQGNLKVRGGTCKATSAVLGRLQKTRYHAEACQLFFSEFCSQSNYEQWESYELFLKDLALERQGVCEEAYVESTAVGSYLSLLQRKREDDSSCRHTLTWPHYVDPWSDMPWYPYAAWSPIFSACPWLEDISKELSNAPYYLWDTINRETILVEDLDDFPDYTAISHTWGRWVPDKADTVQLPGVA